MTVRLEVADGIAEVVLARPEKMNAITVELLEALVGIGEDLAARRDVRVVLLRGEGRAFCAGIDLDSLTAASRGEGRIIDIGRPYKGAANLAQHAVLLWHDLPVPVVAAVHGVAFGGGLQLALGADIRVVQRDARLALMEVKWGLVPDMGGMLLLRDLVRPDLLADLTLTGRIVDGEEARSLGLATRVADDAVAAGRALAREIAAQSPDAVRATQRLLAHPGPREAILLAEAAEQAALFGQPNQREAVAAGMAKRAPQFVD